MLKALVGLVAIALLGASSHSPVWTQASQPMVALEVAPPSVHKGASDKRLPRVQPSAIRKIMCDSSWGTGVVVSPDTVMTAHHVIAGKTTCRDDGTGEVFRIVYSNASQDFAILQVTQPYRKVIKVDCSGFRTGSTYYAYGYAGVGTGDLAMFRLRATDQFAPQGSIDKRTGTVFDGTRLLTGTVIQGMSGGPILDVRGRLVGLNNATAAGYKMGLSREARDTVMCLDYRNLTKRD